MKADSAICILLPLDLTILTSSILEKLRTKMLTATEVAASGTKERKTKISVKSYYRIQIYSLSRSCYICTYLPTKIFTVDSLRSIKLIPPFTAIYTNLKWSLSVYLLLIQSHKRAQSTTTSPKFHYILMKKIIVLYQTHLTDGPSVRGR